jgi:hypothetical protein
MKLEQRVATLGQGSAERVPPGWIGNGKLLILGHKALF